MTLLIDNYDSFTYNIYQMISEIADEEVRVVRNDTISIAELKTLSPHRLVISPGPGTPRQAGISVEAVKFFADKIPILGICLGHQCIAEAFGSTIVQARDIVHGKVQPIDIDGKGILRNLPNPCSFTRYHSLAVDPLRIPEELEVSARSFDGEIMGLRHRRLPIEGVQFHPESIGSSYGERLFTNFFHWRREPLNRVGLLSKAISGINLSSEEAAAFMDELTDGSLEDAYTAGMLTALSAKGISAEEVAACVSVLVEKQHMVKLDAADILDTCGTGGDGLHTFNISSFSALLASSCGATVAKHGNRAVSSKSGSTDFFDALGIPTNLNAMEVAESIREEGFAYMAAPNFHSAMRHAGPVRRVLGVKTIMNTLGPLANPAGADYQIIGVYEDALLPVMARAARMLGVKRVWTVRSTDGLDEISPAAPTRIFRIDEEGRETEAIFNPGTLGISGYTVEDLAGGSADENAQSARELLRGDGSRALREAVCLNAGAALAVAGMAKDIESGYAMAKSALADGRVAAKVAALQNRRDLSSSQ